MPRQGPQNISRNVRAGKMEKTSDPPKGSPDRRVRQRKGKTRTSKKTIKSLIQTAQSTEMRADLGRKLVFLQIVQTSLRVSTFIYLKQELIIDITVIELKVRFQFSGKFDYHTNTFFILHFQISLMLTFKLMLLFLS